METVGSAVSDQFVKRSLHPSYSPLSNITWLMEMIELLQDSAPDHHVPGPQQRQSLPSLHSVGEQRVLGVQLVQIGWAGIAWHLSPLRVVVGQPEQGGGGAVEVVLRVEHTDCSVLGAGLEGGCSELGAR